MSRESIDVLAMARRSLGLMAGAMMLVPAANARAQQPGPGEWRIGASTGAYVPFSSLIKAADAHDTRLSAGPAFSLEPQYLVSGSVAVYASAIAAFGTIRLGSSIRPGVLGPSDQVVLAGTTAGVMLSAADWFGDNLQPTLRLGGGFKWYSFDLADAESQTRPTADIGLGLRGLGAGGIEVTAEVRYLPSSFDQAKLPTRGIAAQDQRQSDLVLAIGIGIRP